MKNFVCRFVGGPMTGLMDYNEALAHSSGRSEDLTEWRNHGALVRRPELDNQPTFDGYLGPMWDGTMQIGDTAFGILRYETQEE